MEYRRFCHAIVFVIMLSALSKGSLEDNPRILQSSSEPRRSRDLVWTHYRKELIDMNQATKYNDGAGSLNWLTRCLELLLDSPSSPGRRLASNPGKKRRIVAAPAQSPLPDGNAKPQKPMLLIEPVTVKSFADPKDPKPSTIQPVTVDPFAVQSGRQDPPRRPKSEVVDHRQKKPGGVPVQPVVTIAAALGGLLVVTALFLLCRVNRGGEKVGTRAERPLFVLNPNAGSFHKSSGNKELGFDGGKVLFFHNVESKSSGEHVSSNGQIRNSPLKLPPGRQVVPQTHVQPQAQAQTRVQAQPQAQAQTRVQPQAQAEAQTRVQVQAQAPPPPPPAPHSAPPPPPPAGPKAPPPPPLKGTRAPPMPPKMGKGGSGAGGSDDGESGAPKAKLKPLFWDKVVASPNRSMVWRDINAGSFVCNEKMMESLFGLASVNQNKAQKKDASKEPQYIEILDKRKAQNLSILLRALNLTTEEVCDALHEGNELPMELISTLLKTPPTQEEEVKLRLYTGDVTLLGPAERFLKTLIGVPFVFERLECLLFMSNFHEEVTGINEALATLEVASKQLKNSRLFLKLLEAVLKTGNRMNDGTYRGKAQAFKLDTLLKLSDVKGTDGKTTLLLFVVHEIIRSEGRRAVCAARANKSLSSVDTEDLLENSPIHNAELYRTLGLEVVSGLSDELEYVKKAAAIDADSFMSTLSQLSQSLAKAKEFMKYEAENLGEDSDKFRQALSEFMERADVEITRLLGEEKRIMALVKITGDYFHGNSGKDEGLRLFVIVRDFLRMLDRVCREIKEAETAAAGKGQRKESPETKQQQSDVDRRLFPEIACSDDEESS